MKIQPYIANYANLQPNRVNAKPQNNSCAFRGEADDFNYSRYGLYNYRDDYYKNKIPLPEKFKKYTRATIGSPVTDERMKDFLINSFKDIGNNCYKGGLAGASDYVKQLSECGIKRFIMLCEPKETGIAEKCEKFGVPLSAIHIPDYPLDSELQIKKFRSKITSQLFVDAMLALREGNCFVGCESGNIRTKKFLSVIQMLDPGCKLNLIGLEPEKDDCLIARIVYNRLSDNVKKLLGYTEDFEKQLLETLKRFKV